MFELFTDRSRRVVVLAQEEARFLNHNFIGTDHLMAGMICEGEGIAAISLDAMGVTLESLRSQIVAIRGHGNSPPSGHIPFLPAAKRALALSLRESLRVGHNFIATEHLLLGILRQSREMEDEEGGLQNVTLAVLSKLGVYPATLTNAIMSRVQPPKVVQIIGGEIPEEPSLEESASIARGKMALAENAFEEALGELEVVYQAKLASSEAIIAELRGELAASQGRHDRLLVRLKALLEELQEINQIARPNETGAEVDEAATADTERATQKFCP